jgi:hypothetical protein
MSVFYVCRCGNVASILAISDKLEREFKLFNEVSYAFLWALLIHLLVADVSQVPEPETSAEVARRAMVPYFM